MNLVCDKGDRSNNGESFNIRIGAPFVLYSDCDPWLILWEMRIVNLKDKKLLKLLNSKLLQTMIVYF